MSDTPIYDGAIDYSKKHAVRDLYRFNQLLPTQTAAITLGQNSPDVYFELPAVPMNHAKSYLEFDFQVPQVGAAGGQTITTDIATLGVPQIARLSLYTRGGVQLAEIQDCSRYLATVLPYTTSRDELMDIDPARFMTAAAPTEPLAPFTPVGFYETDNLVDGAAYAAATKPCNLVPTIGAAPAVTSDSQQDISQLSRIVGAANATPQPSLNAHYQIPLSVFKHTVLAMDKDIYWGQIIILRLTFATVEKIGQSSLLTNNTAFAGIVAPTIANLYLQIARCADPIVAAQLVSKVNSSGHRLVVPYVQQYMLQNNTAASAINLKLNVGYGQRLLRIYNVVYSNAVNTTGMQYLCHNNVGNALVSSYYTTLNNSRLQDQDIVCARHMDYQEMKYMLKGSAIQGARSYRAVHCHIDNWTAGKSKDWAQADSDEIVDGLSLEMEQSYSWYPNVPNATPRAYYSFMIVQKELNISASMITIV
jgi:hypothetical protein